MADLIEAMDPSYCDSNPAERARLAVRAAGSAGHMRKPPLRGARGLRRSSSLAPPYPCLPQGPSAPRVFIRSGVTKPSGFSSNTDLHSRLQKWRLFPACSEETVAQLGSSGIPQTKSNCAAVDRVAILKSLLFLLRTLHECGQMRKATANLTPPDWLSACSLLEGRIGQIGWLRAAVLGALGRSSEQSHELHAVVCPRRCRWLPGSGG
jgi:hypothetical protein